MNHAVVSQKEWLASRLDLLEKEKEKEHSKAREKLTEARQNLPWVAVDKEYVFEGPSGGVTLADLFNGKSQLVVQHFMFGPDWKGGL